jgi:hypothetical protein
MGTLGVVLIAPLRIMVSMILFFTLIVRNVHKGCGMLYPRGLPTIGIATLQLAVNETWILYSKIMRQMIRATGIGEDTFVKDHDGIIRIEVLEAVGHGHDQPVSIPGNIPEKCDDIILRAGIETAGHFIAEKNGRTAHQLHRKSQAPLLPSGKDFDGAFPELPHPHLFQQTINHGITFLSALSAHTESGGILDALTNCQILMSDAELRNITEFGGIEVLFGKIPTIPMNGPLFIAGSDTGNHFKECALAAS